MSHWEPRWSCQPQVEINWTKVNQRLSRHSECNEKHWAPRSEGVLQLYLSAPLSVVPRWYGWHQPGQSNGASARLCAVSLELSCFFCLPPALIGIFFFGIRKLIVCDIGAFYQTYERLAGRCVTLPFLKSMSLGVQWNSKWIYSIYVHVYIKSIILLSQQGITFSCSCVTDCLPLIIVLDLLRRYYSMFGYGGVTTLSLLLNQCGYILWGD